MKTKLGVEFEIDFAHTLRGHPKCGKPHGHTSRIIVEVEGDVKQGDSYQDNMVIEFDAMKKTCWDTIQELDHRNLNLDIPYFKNIIPTTENLAIYIWKKLNKAIQLNCKITVVLYETPRNFVEYSE